MVPMSPVWSQPSGVEHAGRALLVLVIARHDVLAAHENLAGAMLEPGSSESMRTSKAVAQKAAARPGLGDSLSGVKLMSGAHSVMP